MINKLFYKGTNMYLNIGYITMSQILLVVQIKITELIFQIYIPIIYQKTNK